jgi:hypothetical protein
MVGPAFGAAIGMLVGDWLALRFGILAGPQLGVVPANQLGWHLGPRAGVINMALVRSIERLCPHNVRSLQIEL